MRKLMITLAACLLAVPAMAAQTYTYNWLEDDVTFIGTFGTETPDMLASASVGANRTGSNGNGLVLTKNNPSVSGYALGFLAAIWDLEAGDEVTVSLWRYDPMSGMPYFRLWAHYNNALADAEFATGQDMSIHDGNLMGNNSFGVQNGWEQFSYTWTVGAGNTGLVIDAVVYGDLGAVIWIDDIEVTVPDHASVRLPHAVFEAGGPPVAVEVATWSQVKALFQ